jgi:hypothetical protein
MLQAQNVRGDWINVEPIPDAFTCNVRCLPLRSASSTHGRAARMSAIYMRSQTRLHILTSRT